MHEVRLTRQAPEEGAAPGWAQGLRQARSCLPRWAPGLALLAASLALQPVWASDDAGRLSGSSQAAAAPSTPAGGPAPGILASQPKRANFGQERPSQQAAQLADWVVDSGDNQGMPFLIVDKVQAKVLAFDAYGRLQAAAPALLGLARGDDSVPGIGERKMSSILPAERTTPAGRFVASLARDTHGEEILWVDYATAISLHRVVKGTPSEKRAQRLNSPTADDNRISYGCINVPASFYDKVVSPAFRQTNGVVYVLPETRSAREVFGSYEVKDAVRPAGTVQASSAPVELNSASATPSR